MFGYTAIFVTACLVTVISAKVSPILDDPVQVKFAGTRCGTCFDIGGEIFLQSFSTKNCEKPSTSGCTTSNYKCMEFVGTIDVKFLLTTSLNITTRYCAVTKQTGCQKTDLADPNHDPTGIVSKIATGMKKIPNLSSVFSIEKLSGSICVSGSKTGIKAIPDISSAFSFENTPGSVSRITTNTKEIPEISSVYSIDKLSGSVSVSRITFGIKAKPEISSAFSFENTPGSVSVSRITTGIKAKPEISSAVSNDRLSGSAAIISNGWQAKILILLINILLMFI